MINRVIQRERQRERGVYISETTFIMITLIGGMSGSRVRGRDREREVCEFGERTVLEGLKDDHRRDDRQAQTAVSPGLSDTTRLDVRDDKRQRARSTATLVADYFKDPVSLQPVNTNTINA